MSDQNGTPEQEESEGIKNLRREAKEGSDAKAENARLQREMAFMRAGIDTTSKPAQALIASYDGALETDAIKAEATEWGLVKADGTPPPEPSYGEGSPEQQQQAIREQTNGQPAPIQDPPAKPVMDTAIANYHQNRSGGMADEGAQVQAFGEVIRGAAMGDKSTIFDPQEWARQQEAAGHGS